jgi:hypothetical protein
MVGTPPHIFLFPFFIVHTPDPMAISRDILSLPGGLGWRGVISNLEILSQTKMKKLNYEEVVLTPCKVSPYIIKTFI